MKKIISLLVVSILVLSTLLSISGCGEVEKPVVTPTPTPTSTIFENDQKFTITFNGGDGASGQMTSIKLSEGDSVVVPQNMFSMSGYKFDSYWTGYESVYAGDTFVMPSYDLTFTAIWTKKSSHGGGGGSSSSSSNNNDDNDNTGNETTLSTEDIDYIQNNQTAELTISKYKGSEVNVVIPKSVDGKEFTSIAKGAFEDSLVESVEIPSSVTTISDGAFKNCPNLKSVTIGDNTPASQAIAASTKFSLFSSFKPKIAYADETPEITLGDNVFSGCSLLEKIEIIGNLISIGAEAFNGCTKLETFKEHAFDKLESIGARAFDGSGYFNNEENWSNDGLYINNILVAVKQVENITVNDGTVAMTDELFFDNDTIQSVTIPASISALPKALFMKAVNLQTVTFKDIENSKLNVIGEWAFRECESLTQINLPNNLQAIGSFAFAYCGVESILIPSSVVSISDDAFYMCEEIKSYDVAEGSRSFISEDGILYDLGQNYLLFYPAKKDCDVLYLETITRVTNFSLSGAKLKEFVVPEGHNSGYYTEDGVLFSTQTLNDGTSVTSLIAMPSQKTGSYDIPEGVDKIYDSAFQKSQLDSLSIPSSVKEIGVFCFDNSKIAKNNDGDGVYVDEWLISASDVENFVVKEGTKKIVPSAFNNLFNLKSITIPSSVELMPYVFTNSWGENPFHLIETLNIDENNERYSMRKVNDDADCDAYMVLEKYDLVSEGDGLGLNLQNIIGTDIDTIVVPEDVTQISGNVCWLTKRDNVVQIKNIEVEEGNTVYSSENGVLYNKDKTELILCPKNNEQPNGKLEVNENVKSIGENAFADCYKLEEIVLPSGIERIGLGAFSGTYLYNGFNSVNGIIYLGEYLIDGTRAHQNYTIREGTSLIADNAFYSSVVIEEVELPQSVKHIGNMAFAFSSIKSVNIPNEVQNIGQNAFINCNNLTTVDFESGNTSLKAIESHTFSGCQNLKGDINIPDSVTHIYDFAFSKAFNYSDDFTVTTNLHMPSSLEYLGNCAFDQNKNTSFNGECENLTFIGFGAFRESGIEEFTITTDMEIDIYSFVGCKNLVVVNIEEGVTKIPDHSFSNCVNIEEINTIDGEVEKVKQLPNSLKSLGEGAFNGARLGVKINSPLDVGYNALPQMNEMVYKDKKAFLGMNFSTGISYGNVSKIKIEENNVVWEKPEDDIVVNVPALEISSEYIVGKYALNCMCISELTFGSGQINIDSLGLSYATIRNITNNSDNIKVQIDGDIRMITNNVNGKLDLLHIRYTNWDSEKEVVIPNGVEVLNDYIAPSKYKDYTISIPKTVKEIHENFTHGNIGISEIKIDSENENFSVIDGVLYSKDGKELIYYPSAKVGDSFKIPSSVERLASNAFKRCQNLKKIEFSENMKIIPEMAINFCPNLSEVVIPENIVAVSGWAISYCTNISTVYVPKTVQAVGESAFDNAVVLFEREQPYYRAGLGYAPTTGLGVQLHGLKLGENLALNDSVYYVYWTQGEENSAKVVGYVGQNNGSTIPPTIQIGEVEYNIITTN